MSTLVWPAISAEELAKEEQSSTKRELAWLLASLQDTLQSLKAGLEECAELLTPKEPGSTLVLSSLKSESLKGFVTRVGTRIVKGDIKLRLASLPVPRGQNSYKVSISTLPTASSIAIEQLTTTRTLINGALDIIDATRWTGDATNADFISGQLQLLHENVLDAKAALKGGADAQKPWTEDPLPSDAFKPPLADNISFHLSVSEAAIVLHIRTLVGVNVPSDTHTPQSPGPASTGPAQHIIQGPHSYTGFSIRDRLTAALGGGRQNIHDEAHEVFSYRGQEVRVRDKIRVESQDPSLLSAFAKLGALERIVALWRRGLDVVMGRDLEVDDT